MLVSKVFVEIVLEKYLELAKECMVMAHYIAEEITNMKERDVYIESIDLIHASISEIETWIYDSLPIYKV